MKLNLFSSLYGVALSLLFTALFISSKLNAQGSEPPPYDPCTPSLAPQAGCFTGSRTCEDYSDPEFICSPGYCWAAGGISNNQGIPPSGLVSNKIIEIGGTYTITQNVKFENCIFKMRGDSRINISPIGGPSTMKITFDNCDFFGCNEMWQGIVVDASGPTGSLLFLFENGSIEDAYIGLRLDEVNGIYGISNNIFRNNHIGISNLRQNGSNLNASITQNSFQQTANLATQIGSLAGLILPDYPLAHAGIKYVNTNSTVGALSATVGLANFFSCLVYGIISDNCSLSSNNNTFQRIGRYGIWVTEGSVSVRTCRFQISGLIGIMSSGANLTVSNLCLFSGDWIEGIHSQDNINTEQIAIRGNEFNIASPGWVYGVYLERSQSSVGVDSRISLNEFTVNTDPSSSLKCINVVDMVDATGGTSIDGNTMTLNSAQGGIHGIVLTMGNSDFFYVTGNNIHYGTISTSGASFGIWLRILGLQNLSIGNEMRTNDISGIDINLDPPNAACECAFHVSNIQGTLFCQNIVDETYRGFHFLSSNDIDFSENQINSHQYGIRISGGQIGKQLGKGNQWALDPNACILFAASVAGGGNPFNSEFSIPEGFFLPWLPPPAKLDPSPLVSGWFHFEGGPLDYCQPQQNNPARELTPYEIEAVLGTSPQSGVELWDLNRKVYSKLLIFSSLRPSGSPEETFFNSFSDTIVISLAQISKDVRDALQISTADQLAFDTYTTEILEAFDSLSYLDSIMDYSYMINLTETWFAQRAQMLQLVGTNAAARAALEYTRNQVLEPALQNALTANAAISTTQPYETAIKQINELRIRHLLGQAITQALYQQALAIAVQGDSIVGTAALDALVFLAPCDQVLYQENDDRSHVQQNHDNIAVPSLSVSPNPSSGLILVSLPNLNGGMLAVYNAKGQVVKSQSVPQGHSKVSLELKSSTSGFYWVVFTNTEGKIVDTVKILLNR